jgi:hypothetical protein
VSIWGLSWPWKTKKGRTVKSYNKKGHMRVLCIAGGSPVSLLDIELKDGNRRTRCPECGRVISVTGPANRPLMFVHNPIAPYTKSTWSD